MNQDLAFKLSASVSGQQAVDKFKNSIDKVGGAAESLKKTFEGLKRGFEVFAAAFVFDKGIEFGKSLIEMGSNLAHLSEKTGVSVASLASFQGAAEQAGVSAEQLTVGLKKLAVSQVEAVNGSKTMKKAFENLGVGLKDSNGNLLSTDVLMKKIADRFAQFQDGPAKAAIAVKIFGRAGTDLIPFLNEGSEGLTKFGVKIGDDFAERSKEFEDSMLRIKASVKSAGVEALGELLPTLQEISTALEKSPKDTSGLVTGMQILGETLRITAVILEYVKVSLAEIGDITIYLTRAVFRGAIDIWKEFADIINTTAKGLYKFISGDYSGAAAEFKNLGKRFSKAFSEGLDDQGTLTQGLEKRTKARLAEAVKFDQDLSKHSILVGDGNSAGATKPKGKIGGKAALSSEGIDDTSRDRVEEFIKLREEENKQLKESLGDYRLTALELEKVKAARKLDLEALKASKGLNAEQTQSLKEGTEEIKQQRLALIDLEYQQQRTFSYGAKKAFQDYAENAGNAAKNAQRFFNRAFQSMEDGLVDFVKTGTFNFSKFAEAVIDEMIRIQIRQNILSPIIGGFGSLFGNGGGAAASAGTSSAGESLTSGASFAANGGIMTSRGMAKLNTYARGGIANSPQMAIFGEGSTPEAYVPLPDGRRIPVAMKGQGAGGTNVSIVVNVESGKQETTSNSDTGKQIGQLISNAVTAELVKQKRPGGLLAG
jgi:lambda family phage tail tape measure protein